MSFLVESNVAAVLRCCDSAVTKVRPKSQLLLVLQLLLQQLLLLQLLRQLLLQ